MSFQDKLRILYVSMADVSQPNGPGVNEREFLLSLYARLGTRMHALLPKPARPCTELDPSRTTFYRNPQRWDLAGFLLQQRELYGQIRHLSSASLFDLMVVRLSLLPLGCACLGETTLPLAIKTLGEVQGFTQNRGFKGAVAKLLGPLNAALFQQIVYRAIAVDCCTERHYHDHLQDYSIEPEKLLVVQNATNVARFYPGPVRDARNTLGLNHFDPVIGFVGGSPAERGGMQMLELAVRLRDSFPQLGIVIVGKDTNGLLQRRARELHVEDRAMITGEVAYEEVPSYIRAFDLGMALDRPSRWQLTGNSYQKVRQYLACGKPVVTCIEPESELVQQGFVEPVPADDLTVIEHAVRNLLARTPTTREAFTERAARFAREHLSTEMTLDQRLQFWEQRLEESRHNQTCLLSQRAA